MFVSEKALGEAFVWPVWPKTEPPVVSKEGIIEFLKTKNPNEEYSWLSLQCCLFAQYLKYRGIEAPSGRGIPKEWFDLHDDYREIAKAEPHTFGMALRRAEKWT